MCTLKFELNIYTSEVKGIKQDFTEVVIDNTAWIYRYVSYKTSNKDITEDLVQEIFIKAYRAYENYYEEGKLKGWLMRITQNTLRSYFSLKSENYLLSLDAEYETGESIYHYITNGITPEDKIIHKELMTDIIGVVNRLPREQKEVFTYRFINGYSVLETSAILHIPAGSVKSKTHYAIKKIREELGVTSSDNKRRNNIMLCKDAYKYLFMYAKGTIEVDKKEAIKEHITSCSECAGVVSALEKLIPTMTYAQFDETSHFLINFPELNISYSGVGFHMYNSEKLNDTLKQNDGYIPNGEMWFGNGFSSCNQILAEFDNEGNEIEIEVIPNGETHNRIKVVRMNKIYDPVMWIYNTYAHDGSVYNVKKSLEDPKLYYGSMHNMLGSDNYAKSAIYAAIPRNADNVRVKRGNGVIDCDTYKFAYADRYVTAEERLSLDYSYIIK